MMYKVFFIWLVFTFSMYAHQADVSTTMLVQRENGSWILQVSASLTAYQYEVKANNPFNPYKTPEEFKEMVISHLKNNISFVFNGNITPILQNPQVVLGHETKVVFEVVGIPENITDVEVTNTSFNGIFKNQSKLLLFKNDFQKEVFTLNAANEHSISLIAGNDKFTEKAKESKKDYSELMTAGIALLILGIGNIIWFYFKKKKPELKGIKL